jgi:hypothetical protein
MKVILIAVMTTLAVAGPSQVSAQQPEGFVTGGISTGENDGERNQPHRLYRLE